VRAGADTSGATPPPPHPHSVLARGAIPRRYGQSANGRADRRRQAAAATAKAPTAAPTGGAKPPPAVVPQALQANLTTVRGAAETSGTAPTPPYPQPLLSRGAVPRRYCQRANGRADRRRQAAAPLVPPVAASQPADSAGGGGHQRRHAAT